MAKNQEPVKQEKVSKDPREREREFDVLIRIFGYDIPGSKNVFTGLTRIKGISWAISNFICIKLKLDKTKKISELSKPEISTIEEFIQNLDAPEFMKNRRSDPELGTSSHLYSTDLDMKKEFDIKRMKKMKSYKGIRHSSKLPVRGQRTRANFRAKGKAVGVKRKAKW